MWYKVAIYFSKIALAGWFLRTFSRHCQKFLEKGYRKILCNYEQLKTYLCEIERAINQRPLTYVADENYEEVLTPYHMIFGMNIDDDCTTDFYETTSDNA